MNAAHGAHTARSTVSWRYTANMVYNGLEYLKTSRSSAVMIVRSNGFELLPPEIFIHDPTPISTAEFAHRIPLPQGFTRNHRPIPDQDDRRDDRGHRQVDRNSRSGDRHSRNNGSRRDSRNDRRSRSRGRGSASARTTAKVSAAADTSATEDPTDLNARIDKPLDALIDESTGKKSEGKWGSRLEALARPNASPKATPIEQANARQAKLHAQHKEIDRDERELAEYCEKEGIELPAMPPTPE